MKPTSPAPHAEQPSKLLFPAVGVFYQSGEPLAYAMLRLCLGIIMVTHGLPKLLGTAHGSMADPMAGSIHLIENVLHLPFPQLLGLFVAWLEGLGGLLLALGLATRPLAVAMAIQMAAIAYILGPNWPWIDRGIEYPVLMGFLFTYIAFKGAGRHSLDRLLGREI
ncbi:DoxX family protein [Pseudomonas fluorescens]|uniref:DoxX family protein n=1 Tax=Pseudomonas fluorescens TaxID=294 RepID=A0A944HEG1_PSEFL|nr:DoxX family protein [Pseudomonas fluorescens]MBT2297535.1 DoxX family protein [Pseudomonas fluorescens]MBT2305733.1 DoxX family protein [Pseudomonas fluorescens]MBT2314244.1 DoxX family protein [Pseudomonas fluorescens]MBT2319264.1 DoxX family protein [Pseudomonas fluorescens]MBT2327474.1 DoxX family protein [Pseudomonas fluorescens]